MNQTEITTTVGKPKPFIGFFQNGLKIFRRFQLSLTPQQNILFGFLTYTLVGWALLCAPILQKQSVGALDNLFTATSAISTTGLVTLSVFDNYNIYGQLVILLLIQIGGVGYMTFTSFILLSNKHNLTHWHQRVLNAEFSLPSDLQIKDFLKSVILFTILIESIGAVMFYIAFTRAGVDHNFAVWSSIFHSISSFCTAGFGLYNDSFEQFALDPMLNMTIAILAISGSMGFIVVTDFWNKITKKSKALTYTTKIILLATFLLLGLGTAIIFLFEPSVTSFETGNRLMLSFFQSMTALTTVGFNTIPNGGLALPVLMVTILLMYIGASPSGTGGGMKSTTLTALVAIMWAKIRNKTKVTFLGKGIPAERLSVANSIFLLYASVMFFATFALSFTEKYNLEQILFETTSAIGTVGLSMGITGGLSSHGKVILILVMFIGRMGLLTFGMAILAKRKKGEENEFEADLAI